MILFIDTNIYLHYRPLDELNLRQLTGDSSITVVFPSVTLRELDVHKTRHSSRKIRDRAGRILRDVEKAISESARLKGEISVEFFSIHPKKQIDEYGFNAAWNDDVLLATAIAYRETTTNDDIAIISQDIGVRLKCKEYGIATFELPVEMALIENQDEAEIENRKLKLEIERLRNAHPQLEARFAGTSETGSVSKFRIETWSPIEEHWLEQKLVQVRSEFPKLRLPERTIDRLTALGSVDFLPLGAMRKYNEELDIYYSKMEKYYRKRHEWSEVANRTISFTIEIGNTGTAPADDVHVFLRFPNSFRLMTEEDLPKSPLRPRPPEKPISHLERLSRPLYMEPFLYNRSTYIPTVETIPTFKITEEGGYSVTDHFGRIKHGIPVTLPKLFVQFPSRSKSHSFSSEYELRPANSPTAFTGNLNFVVEVD